MAIIFEPIGVIHTPFQEMEGMPIQPTGARDVPGWIEIDPAYESGLSDLDGFSHLVLLYYFHRSEGCSLRVTPFLDDQERGLFSTRAPRRPNAIGMSVVRLRGVDENRLDILDVDVLNGTPLLDIKPYVPVFDCPDGSIEVGWLARHGKDLQKTAHRTADDRFIGRRES